MVFRALVKCLGIIGEAASRVSAQARRRAIGISWEQIGGMRNRLIHAYFDTNMDSVWKTVVEDLPKLERPLMAILEADSVGD
jgi:uncharacterized protein with HEPN domain